MAPAGTLTINNAAEATNDRDVTLTFTATGADQVRVTNGSNRPTGDWVELSTDMAWRLSAGDGTKHVTAQFRSRDTGQDSEPVTAQVILDTAAPTITETVAGDGSTLDTRTGDLATIGGAVSDEGSGLTGVTVTAAGAPGQSAPAQITDGRWIRPIGAPSSGPQTYTATAADKAGNIAAVTVTVTVLVDPPTGSTRLRDSTLTLTAGDVDAIVDTTPTTVTFSGDLRSTLSDRDAIVGTSSDNTVQVMRRVEHVDYDGDSDETVVTGPPAGLLDVFSELHVSGTRTNAGGVDGDLPTAAAAANCDEFDDRGSFGVAVDATLHGTVPAGAPFGGRGVDVAVTGGLAAYIDVDLSINGFTSFFGPNIEAFRAEIGVLLCAEATAVADLGVEEVLGGDWTTGALATNPRLSAITASTAPGLSLELIDLFDDIPGFPIGTTGLTVKPTAPVELNASIDAALDMSVGYDVAVGGVFGYDIDDGLIQDTIVHAGESPTNGAAADYGITVDMTVGAGLSTEFVEAIEAAVTFVEAGVGHRWATELDWDNGLVGANSHITGGRNKRCLVGHVGSNFELSLSAGVGPFEASITLLAVDIASISLEHCYHDEPFVSDTTAVSIADTLAVATTGQPYQQRPDVTGTVTGWTLTGGSLPPGLSLHPVTGTISGTPTAAGTWTFQVRVRDTSLRATTATLTLSVYDPPPPPPPPAALNASAGRLFTCVAYNTGTIKCSGDNFSGQLGRGTASPIATTTPAAVVGITDATAVATGADHACALRSTGVVSCWGENMNGQLGDGTTLDRSSPVDVTGITDATAIVVGAQHSCALRSNGTVSCWGDGWYGQLGTGSYRNAKTPAAAVDLANVTALSAGANHTCAVTASHHVKCWGNNSDKRAVPGAGAVPVPTRVPGVLARSVAAGPAHTCAVTLAATVACWGGNSDGQLGAGDTATHTDVVAVNGPTRVVALAAGGNYPGALSGSTCIIDADGSVSCWGGNYDGQLGTGDRDDRLTPTTVAQGVTATSITMSRHEIDAHTCISSVGDQILCWGANSYGQLGQGTGPLRWLSPGATLF